MTGDRHDQDSLGAAFVAAALTVLLSFVPEVEASVPAPLAKGDRLDIHEVGSNCSEQTWPNIEPPARAPSAPRS